MNVVARIALLGMLAVGGIPADTSAQTISDTADRRILGGHVFVPSGFLRDPFVVTSLRYFLGLGKATNLKNSVLVIDDEPVVQLEGELTFVGLDIMYQQAVREWLAASFRFGGVGRIGTNTTSLLAQGINAASSGEMEWMMRIARRERWQLSTAVGLTNTSGTIINVYDWVVDGSELIRNTNALGGYLGLRGAYAFNPTLGVFGALQAGYGESFDPRAEDQWFGEAEAALSLDLDPRRGWPIGFVLGGRYSSLPEAVDDIGQSRWVALLRLAYTGREDFVVGLDFTRQGLPQYFSDELVQAGTVGFGVNYYF